MRNPRLGQYLQQYFAEPNEQSWRELYNGIEEFLLKGEATNPQFCGVLRRSPKTPWGREHSLAVLVAWEREFGRSVKDHEWLVLSEDLPKQSELAKNPIVFLCDNLRSAWNMGSIFRLAETLGVERVILTGYTPQPSHPAVLRAAMGAEVPWQHFDFFHEAAEHLKKQSFKLIALETVATPTTQWNATLPQKSAFVVGNERFGLAPGPVLANCDEVRTLPVFGHKNSLNVTHTLAAIGYQWINEWCE